MKGPVAPDLEHLAEHAVGPGDLVAQDRVSVVVVLRAGQNRKAAIFAVRYVV